ncbi:phage holin family protein [Paracoccus beibuensis]|uniref:phage holin family protein n=1 Tax=Paracoccus beibuensis TaxID=547602 RepID=UPI00223F01B9|nr:phage holin family protein [Paracoccus beibuensis]
MFDFARRLQLAAGDTVRRAALKAAAGIVGMIGAGFLLAALWSFLAETLGWGAGLASLAMGAGFALIAAILFTMSSRRNHEMPTTEDLKREVQARATLATDATVERARAEASRLVDMAENRAHALMDEASYRAAKLADDAERRVFGSLPSVGIRAGGPALPTPTRDRADLGPGTAPRATRTTTRLIWAFAVGVTLAAKLQERRGRTNHPPGRE